MKKIIKIAALILALLCIGTSFASCGMKNNTFFGKSNEELAAEIKSGMTLTISSINHSNSIENGTVTYYSSDLFTTYYKGTTIEKPPKINQNYIHILLDEEDRTLTIDFRYRTHGYGLSTGTTIFTINLPVKIKSTSYGTISEDGNSVIAEYLYTPQNTWDPSQRTNIEPDITITY